MFVNNNNNFRLLQLQPDRYNYKLVCLQNQQAVKLDSTDTIERKASIYNQYRNYILCLIFV